MTKRLFTFAPDMSDTNKSMLSGLLTARCPRCREGKIFTQKSVFPLNTCLRMEEHCSCCDQKIKVENNYGQGMNFVFIFIIFALTLCVYWPVFGLSYKDNSVFYYLGAASILSLVLQPWLMRFSRVLFLYLVIGYKKDAIEQHKAGQKNTIF